MSLLTLLTSYVLAANPLALTFSGGRRLVVQRLQGETTLVSVRGGRPVAQFMLEDFPIGSRIEKLEAFSTKDGDFVYADFFNSYEGTGRLRSCSTAYLLQVGARAELRLRDKLQYQCESTAGESTRENPSFSVRYRLDRQGGRLLRL